MKFKIGDFIRKEVNSDTWIILRIINMNCSQTKDFKCKVIHNHNYHYYNVNHKGEFTIATTRYKIRKLTEEEVALETL